MSKDLTETNIKETRKILLEFRELRSRLEEAEQTLEAIRSGDVDALVVYGEQGEKVYTLKGADEPYRIFVETMQEGAITLSVDGTILYCNQSFADMAGLALEKVIGHSIQQLLFGREGEGFDHILNTLGEDSARAEMIVLQPSRELPVQVSFTRVESDGPAYYALTVTDQSAQREHENQLQKANGELEGFCYSVSHDLRAPLRNIIGAANVVLEDYAAILPPEGKEDLAQISDSADYLGRLIDDLLAYSRLAKHELQLDKVDLSRLSAAILESSDIKEMGLAEWHVEPGMTAFGDERLVRLALENLLSNAVKYSTKNAKPKVEVGQLTVEGAPVFFVSDNGIGFEMTYAEKIFRPFERLHRHSEFPGTGIGLANARRIISRHGGEIWAESHPDKGATFYFTLPVPDQGQSSVKVTTGAGELH